MTTENTYSVTVGTVLTEGGSATYQTFTYDSLTEFLLAAEAAAPYYDYFAEVSVDIVKIPVLDVEDDEPEADAYGSSYFETSLADWERELLGSAVPPKRSFFSKVFLRK